MAAACWGVKQDPELPKGSSNTAIRLPASGGEHFVRVLSFEQSLFEHDLNQQQQEQH